MHPLNISVGVIVAQQLLIGWQYIQETGMQDYLHTPESSRQVRGTDAVYGHQRFMPVTRAVHDHGGVFSQPVMGLVI